MAASVVSRTLLIVGLLTLGLSGVAERSHPPCQHITTAGTCLDRAPNWGRESTLAGAGFGLIAIAWAVWARHPEKRVPPPSRPVSLNIERYGWR